MFFGIGTSVGVVASILAVVLMAINRDSTVLIVFAAIAALLSWAMMMLFVFRLWGKLFSVYERVIRGSAPLRPYVLLLFTVALFFGTTSGAYAFWILDPDASRGSQWQDIDDASAWRVYVRSIYTATLIFGTGGTTQFTPISVGTQLYASFLIYLNIAAVVTVLGVIAGVLYERKKKAKANDNKKNDAPNVFSSQFLPSKFNRKEFPSSGLSEWMFNN